MQQGITNTTFSQKSLVSYNHDIQQLSEESQNPDNEGGKDQICPLDRWSNHYLETASIILLLEKDQEKKRKTTCLLRDLVLQHEIFMNCSSISKTTVSQFTCWLFCEIAFQNLVPSSISLFAILIWFLNGNQREKKALFLPTQKGMFGSSFYDAKDYEKSVKRSFLGYRWWEHPE